MDTFSLTPEQYLLLFALGGAAIAMWANLRFPDLAPSDIRGVGANVVASIATAHLVVQVGYGAAGTSPARLAAVTIGLALPAVVYVFLSAIWLIRMSQSSLSRYSR